MAAHRRAATLTGRRAFQQVDVFSATPFLGNPVAVVLDADGLDAAAMQRIARWTNLSETTFVGSPRTTTADYRLRIFTPHRELPFAGHPTLGSCHAWLTSGGTPRDRSRIVQDCDAGPITLRRTPAGLAFAAPPLIRSGPLSATRFQRVAGALGVDPASVVDAAWVDNGPGWVGVLLADAAQVQALTPQLAGAGADRVAIGVAGPTGGGEAAIEVRAFVGEGARGWWEDPVTGSLNAGLAQWLLAAGHLRAPYVAAQGACLGRQGRVHVSVDDDGAVWIAGATVTVVGGTIEL